MSIVSKSTSDAAVDDGVDDIILAVPETTARRINVTSLILSLDVSLKSKRLKRKSSFSSIRIAETMHMVDSSSKESIKSSDGAE